MPPKAGCVSCRERREVWRARRALRRGSGQAAVRASRGAPSPELVARGRVSSPSPLEFAAERRETELSVPSTHANGRAKGRRPGQVGPEGRTEQGQPSLNLTARAEREASCP